MPTLFQFGLKLGSVLLDRIASTSASTLMSGLVSYWRLDETSGTRADAVGDNDLTDVNTVLYDTGIHNNAASFVAANTEQLSVACPAELKRDQERTLAFWYYPTANETGVLEISNGSQSGVPFLYLNQTGGTLRAYTAGDYTAGVAAALNAWHLVVFTYAPGTVTATLWVDGASATRVAADNDFDSSFLRFGSGYAGYLDGLLDEVGVWNRVLLDDERTELYAAGAGKFLNAAATDFE